MFRQSLFLFPSLKQSVTRAMQDLYIFMQPQSQPQPSLSWAHFSQVLYVAVMEAEMFL